MDFFDALNTSSAALSAQRLRMNLISGNLANVNTTRTSAGWVPIVEKRQFLPPNRSTSPLSEYWRIARIITSRP